MHTSMHTSMHFFISSFYFLSSIPRIKEWCVSHLSSTCV